MRNSCEEMKQNTSGSWLDCYNCDEPSWISWSIINYQLPM